MDTVARNPTLWRWGSAWASFGGGEGVFQFSQGLVCAFLLWGGVVGCNPPSPSLSEGYCLLSVQLRLVFIAV